MAVNFEDLSDPVATTTTHPHETSGEDASVKRTLFEYDDALVELSAKGNLFLIKVSGIFCPELGEEIEKIALRCRGDIGFVFGEIRRDPKARTATKFDVRSVRLLRSLKTRCENRGFQFFLCKPPRDLLDALKLFSAGDEFQVVDDEDAMPHTQEEDRRAARAEKLRTRDGLSTNARREKPKRDRIEQGKKIYSMDVDLERTESLDKQLDSAAECVESLLPRQAPNTPGYEFAFAYESYEKVGGDFFDFVELDDGRFGISIGDVSGHGIDAALVMGISKKLLNIRACDPRFATPSAVLSQVNEDLHRDLDRKTFVTALYGTLDLETGTFDFARAGHEFPMVFRPRGHQSTLEPKGMALGMVNRRIFDIGIENSSVVLEPGDCLLLVTDGLAECRNEKSAFYERERLLFDLSQANPDASAREMLDTILKKILTFANGSPREDDMTGILIKRCEE